MPKINSVKGTYVLQGKQRHKRYQARSFCRICDDVNEKSLGCLIDISQGGLKIMGEKPIFEGRIYRLSVVMPKEIDGSKTLELNAKCLWNKKSSNPNFYFSGFEFIEADKKTIERITEFTKTAIFHYPESLVVKVE